jgi:hypothetical protein
VQIVNQAVPRPEISCKLLAGRELDMVEAAGVGLLTHFENIQVIEK